VTVPRRARVAPAPPASCLLLSSRLAPASTLFPYTTLFRSNPGLAVLAAMASGIALIGVWLFVAFGRGAEKYGKAILIAFSLLEGVVLGSLIFSMTLVEFEHTSGAAIVGQAILATTAIFIACL